MSDAISITIDGVEIPAERGQTILLAAEAAGIYIPRLCAHKELAPGGHCRVCTVLVNGRPQSACTHPVAPGQIVQSETPELIDWRKAIIEMLFVEGNHFCMFCEKSGNCELQALAYRFGMTTPRYPYQFPKRDLDASHPDVFIDHNRCILCGRCVRASQQLDGKGIFGFVHRGHRTKVAVNAAAGLGETELALADRAVMICPTGAILRKREGFAIPVGKRIYDQKPIGTEIEDQRPAAGK